MPWVHSRGSIGAGATGQSGTGHVSIAYKKGRDAPARQPGCREAYVDLCSTGTNRLYRQMNANVRKVVPAQSSGVKTHQLRFCHVLEFARISLLFPDCCLWARGCLRRCRKSWQIWNNKFRTCNQPSGSWESRVWYWKQHLSTVVDTGQRPQDVSQQNARGPSELSSSQNPQWYSRFARFCKHTAWSRPCGSSHSKVIDKV